MTQRVGKITTGCDNRRLQTETSVLLGGNITAGATN